MGEGDCDILEEALVYVGSGEGEGVAAQGGHREGEFGVRGQCLVPTHPHPTQLRHAHSLLLLEELVHEELHLEGCQLVILQNLQELSHLDPPCEDLKCIPEPIGVLSDEGRQAFPSHCFVANSLDQ